MADDALRTAERASGTETRRGSELQRVQAYLDGTADPATAAEVEAKLADPNSDLMRALGEVCRPRPDTLPSDG